MMIQEKENSQKDRKPSWSGTVDSKQNRIAITVGNSLWLGHLKDTGRVAASSICDFCQLLEDLANCNKVLYLINEVMRNEVCAYV